MESNRDRDPIGDSDSDSAVITNINTNAKTMHAATDDTGAGAGTGTGTISQQSVTTNHAEMGTETERDRKASQSSGKDVERRPSVAVASGSRTHGSELKPIGIINEQNTCFLNSTFQAVRSNRIRRYLVVPRS